MNRVKCADGGAYYCVTPPTGDGGDEPEDSDGVGLAVVCSPRQRG